MKNNKTRFFYVLYSDKTWVFDQSECAYYSIYIINWDKEMNPIPPITALVNTPANTSVETGRDYCESMEKEIMTAPMTQEWKDNLKD